MDINDFTTRLYNLSKRVPMVSSNCGTEEATKNALIMPFLHQVLAYDIFDPTEVVPEFTADTPGKRAEKVDYAILKEGEVQILIECKKHGDKLSVKHAAQLFRYFSVTKARVGILTNGVEYEFYTDLEQQNVMDDVPFLTLNLLDIDKHAISQVAKLTKHVFDVNSVVDAAGDLKYLNQIKKVIAEQFRNPDEELVKFLTSKVYSGIQTPRIKTQFTELSKSALKQFLSDSVNARLKSAMGEEERDSMVFNVEVNNPVINNAEVVEAEDDETSRVVTTEEEREGYHIVRAILRKVFEVERITHRDTQSYFGILLDDNNRKPLCRLHFNAKQKYLGIVGEDKKETRYPISTLDDIYSLADTLLANSARFL